MVHFIATPIGNLKEITYLAVEKLNEVDCIYAENPRHSLILLNAYNIKKPVYEFFKFNEVKASQEIIAKLKDGQTIAVISDAGTPLISDPGDVLRQNLIKENLPFTIVGNNCACISALVLSGLNTQNFCFLGFLPSKTKQREKALEEIKNLKATLIFYIAVHDIKKDLEFLFSALGTRKSALVREISKKFEEVIRFNLGDPIDVTPKGEFVLVIEGVGETVVEINEADLTAELKVLIDSGVTKKDVSKILAQKYGLVAREIYNIAVKL